MEQLGKSQEKDLLQVVNLICKEVVEKGTKWTSFWNRSNWSKLTGRVCLCIKGQCYHFLHGVYLPLGGPQPMFECFRNNAKNSTYLILDLRTHS